MAAPASATAASTADKSAEQQGGPADAEEPRDPAEVEAEAAARAEEERAAAASARTRMLSSALAGKRVLVVPSDSVAGFEVCSELRRLGASVVGAALGSQTEAVQRLSHLSKAKTSSNETVNDIVQTERDICDAARSCDAIIVSLRDNEQLTNAILAMLFDEISGGGVATAANDKVLIAVTSAMTWSKVSKRELKGAQRSLDTSSGDDNASSDPCDSRSLRTCAAGWRITLEAELNVLRADSSRGAGGGGLKTHVVCPGLLYGCGEIDHGFHPVFKAAWEGFPVAQIGHGRNRLPTVHVKDLANVVVTAAAAGVSSAAAESMLSPLPRYIFATDTSTATQADVLGAISSSLAPNTVAQRLDLFDRVSAPQPGMHHPPSELGPVPQARSEMDLSKLTHLFLDLPLQRTAHEMVRPAPSSAARQEPEPESKADGQPFSGGVAEIVREYTAARKLSPIRILLLSSPDNDRTIEDQVPADANGTEKRTPAAAAAASSSPCSLTERLAASLSSYYTVPIATREDMGRWGESTRMDERVRDRDRRRIEARRRRHVERMLEKQQREMKEAAERGQAAAAAEDTSETGTGTDGKADASLVGAADTPTGTSEDKGGSVNGPVADADSEDEPEDEPEELEPEELSFELKFTHATRLNNVLRNHGCIMVNMFDSVAEGMSVLTKEVSPESSKPPSAEQHDQAATAGESKEDSDEPQKSETVPMENHFPTLCVVIDTELVQPSSLMRKVSNVSQLGVASDDAGSRAHDANIDANSAAAAAAEKGNVDGSAGAGPTQPLTDEQKAERLGVSKEEYCKRMSSFRSLVKGTADDGSASLQMRLQAMGAQVVTVDSPKTVKEIATIVRRTLGKPRNYLMGSTTNVKTVSRAADDATTAAPVNETSAPAEQPASTAAAVVSGAADREAAAASVDERMNTWPYSCMPEAEAETLLRLRDTVKTTPREGNERVHTRRGQTDPLTRYMNQNVMPVVLEGMLKLCLERPTDPIEDLATFLESRAAASRL